MTSYANKPEAPTVTDTQRKLLEMIHAEPGPFWVPDTAGTLHNHCVFLSDFGALKVMETVRFDRCFLGWSHPHLGDAVTVRRYELTEYGRRILTHQADATPRGGS